MEPIRESDVDLHFMQPTRALLVANEFIKFYYSMLNKSPPIMHRFYMKTSMFKHNKLPIKIGQKAIHECIMGLNLKDSIVTLNYVDAQESIDGGIIVQTSGSILLINGQDRPFVQMFVLAPQTDNKFVVLNDVLIYEDENNNYKEGEIKNLQTKVKNDKKLFANITQLPEVATNSELQITDTIQNTCENVLKVLFMQGSIGVSPSFALMQGFNSESSGAIIPGGIDTTPSGAVAYEAIGTAHSGTMINGANDSTPSGAVMQEGFDSTKINARMQEGIVFTPSNTIKQEASDLLSGAITQEGFDSTKNNARMQKGIVFTPSNTMMHGRKDSIPCGAIMQEGFGSTKNNARMREGIVFTPSNTMMQGTVGSVSNEVITQSAIGSTSNVALVQNSVDSQANIAKMQSGFGYISSGVTAYGSVGTTSNSTMLQEANSNTPHGAIMQEKIDSSSNETITQDGIVSNPRDAIMQIGIDFKPSGIITKGALGTTSRSAIITETIVTIPSVGATQGAFTSTSKDAMMQQPIECSPSVAIKPIGMASSVAAMHGPISSSPRVTILQKKVSSSPSVTIMQKTISSTSGGAKMDFTPSSSRVFQQPSNIPKVATSVENVLLEQAEEFQNYELKATASLTNIPLMLSCSQNQQYAADNTEIKPFLNKPQKQLNKLPIYKGPLEVVSKKKDLIKEQISSKDIQQNVEEMDTNKNNVMDEQQVQQFANPLNVATVEEQMVVQNMVRVDSANSIDSQPSYTSLLTGCYESKTIGKQLIQTPENNIELCRMCPNNLFNMDSSYYEEFPPVNTRRKTKQKHTGVRPQSPAQPETAIQGRPTYAYLVKAKVSKETILRIIENQLAQVKSKTLKRKQKLNVRISNATKNKAKGRPKNQQKAKKSEELDEPLIMPEHENYKKNRRNKTLLKYSERIKAKNAVLANNENKANENTQEINNTVDSAQEVVMQNIEKLIEINNVADKHENAYIFSKNDDVPNDDKKNKQKYAEATNKSNMLKNMRDETRKLKDNQTTDKPTCMNFNEVRMQGAANSGNKNKLELLNNDKATENLNNAAIVAKNNNAVVNKNANNKNNLANENVATDNNKAKTKDARKFVRQNSGNKKTYNKTINNNNYTTNNKKTKNINDDKNNKANDVKDAGTVPTKNVTTNVVNANTDAQQRNTTFRADNRDPCFYKPNQLFVGRVPYNATKDDLRNIFSEFGIISEIALLKAPNSSVPNYSFVTYSTHESMMKCLQSRPIYFPTDLPYKHRLNVEQRKPPREANKAPNDPNRTRVFTNTNYKY